MRKRPALGAVAVQRASCRTAVSVSGLRVILEPRGATVSPQREVLRSSRVRASFRRRRRRRRRRSSRTPLIVPQRRSNCHRAYPRSYCSERCSARPAARKRQPAAATAVLTAVAGGGSPTPPPLPPSSNKPLFAAPKKR